RWDSPVMAGFQLQVQYGNGGAGGSEGTPTTNSGVFSAGLFYNNGPLVIGVATQYNEQFRARNVNDYAWSVAASHQFPKIKIGGVYERLNYDCWVQPSIGFSRPLGTADCFVQSPGMTRADLNRNFWGISATIDLGPGQLYADWSRGADGSGSAVSSQCRS